MLSLISFIIRYRIPLAVVAAIIAAYGYGWMQYNAGYSKGYTACDAAYLAASAAKVEKRNEIANNRPDDAATIKRLQNGTF